MITEEKQQEFINQQLNQWAAETQAVVFGILSERQGYVPARTLNVITQKVLQAKGNTTAKYFLSFNDSARHVGMRQLEYRRRPITHEENFILNWVLKQGLKKFKHVPGYDRKSRVGISREQQASRIASAIIVHKRKNLGRKRRVPRRANWYNKDFYSQIEVLVEQIRTNQAEFFLEGTKEEITEMFTKN